MKQNVPVVRVGLRSAPTFWRCEPSWSWTSRPLADHLLWCVLDGRGVLEYAGRRHELHPGVCAVFRPGDTPRASHDPHRRLLVFGMHFTATPTAAPEPRCGEVMDRELLGVLARTSDAAYQRQDALGTHQAELCLQQLITLVWDAVHNPGRSGSDAAIDEIARLLRQDPGRVWSVAEMARRALLSRAQFTRRFVARLGMSPAQYLIQARIDRAHQLLTESGMTVTETAAALGYTDVPYFSRQYRQRTGRSPSQDR
ncbi:AraC family transcriptional regulator [Kribbella solani]|uniref:AraC family transcriptional regulator n=1 Tax=Kribbella solani TaxID=236067 RepID=UPI0029A6CA2A|nr:AraC family transcriptional regulator [Kribbella solani]MDX3004354.1 AraC family transcriptional regulator [Kribbella solani]